MFIFSVSFCFIDSLWKSWSRSRGPGKSPGKPHHLELDNDGAYNDGYSESYAALGGVSSAALTPGRQSRPESDVMSWKTPVTPVIDSAEREFQMYVKMYFSPTVTAKFWSPEGCLEYITLQRDMWGFLSHLGVSSSSVGFSIIINIYKPSIVGNPHVWKPPCGCVSLPAQSGSKKRWSLFDGHSGTLPELNPSRHNRHVNHTHYLLNTIICCKRQVVGTLVLMSCCR